MYFDNLTIAGMLVAGAYALLPVLFGRELWRVREDDAEAAPLPPAAPTYNPTATPAVAEQARRANELARATPCA
ncbi:hypothetical protein [uncultured Thiohalocapsa sp.]|uniref:hypothetical protein n=1 Tax=uncultured Thiohalocapsa sp. TaxID=768990 RepID=UPI0025E15A9F|nr:hypothetical protein [uncultured Thiohalocapsa sp.]